MWRSLRDELHPKGFELVTVGLDTLGDDVRAHLHLAGSVLADLRPARASDNVSRAPAHP